MCMDTPVRVAWLPLRWTLNGPPVAAPCLTNVPFSKCIVEGTRAPACLRVIALCSARGHRHRQLTLKRARQGEGNGGTLIQLQFMALALALARTCKAAPRCGRGPWRGA